MHDGHLQDVVVLFLASLPESRRYDSSLQSLLVNALKRGIERHLLVTSASGAVHQLGDASWPLVALRLRDTRAAPRLLLDPARALREREL